MSAILNMLDAIANHYNRSKFYYSEIQLSRCGAAVYTPVNFKLSEAIKKYDETSTAVVNMAVEEFLRNELHALEGRTLVLNFSDSFNPGGDYILGGTGQEESLCRCTTLYELLRTQKDYYRYNRKNKSEYLYEDRVLYCPDVMVLDREDDIIGKVDIISCAAPSVKSVSDKECSSTLFGDKVKLIFESAVFKEVDNLILGAWGYNSGYSPEFISREFYNRQKDYYGYFRNIIYIVPNSDTYNTFEDIFGT